MSSVWAVYQAVLIGLGKLSSQYLMIIYSFVLWKLALSYKVEGHVYIRITCMAFSNYTGQWLFPARTVTWLHQWSEYYHSVMVTVHLGLVDICGILWGTSTFVCVVECWAVFLASSQVMSKASFLLGFGYGMFPSTGQTHMLNTWSPAGGTILRSHGNLRTQSPVEEGSRGVI